jgi:hypothetical protein
VAHLSVSMAPHFSDFCMGPLRNTTWPPFRGCHSRQGGLGWNPGAVLLLGRCHDIWFKVQTTQILHLLKYISRKINAVLVIFEDFTTIISKCTVFWDMTQYINPPPPPPAVFEYKLFQSCDRWLCSCSGWWLLSPVFVVSENNVHAAWGALSCPSEHRETYNCTCAYLTSALWRGVPL